MENHFEPKEHECKCGCGLQNMNRVHMDMLNQARDLAGIPFVITSGSRCSQHNKDEGGRDTSDHLTGEGSDVEVKTSQQRFLILRAAFVAGFRRIGIGKTFIHLGTNENNPQKVQWLY